MFLASCFGSSLVRNAVQLHEILILYIRGIFKITFMTCITFLCVI